MNSLKIDNISHLYGKEKILDGLSLEIKEGEVVCLLGPSGCGKSTILRLVAGLEPLSKGKLSIGGKVVSSAKKFLAPEKRSVGLVFQNPSLFPHMTIIENVAFGLKKGKKAKKLEQAAERLGAVGMAVFAQKYPHQISGGEQQRVALARALAIEPRIMLLDEPFANLDSVLRKRIREESLSLLKSMNIATLLVTHDPEEALRMADKIYVMQHGRIVQSGTPRELYLQPRNSFVARFFGELNEVNAIVKKGFAETSIGKIPVGKMPDGTNAKIFIRPEAIKLYDKKTKASIEAKVSGVRFLGLTSIVLLKVKGEDGKLRARLLGTSLPMKGKKVYLSIDMDHVFTFSVADEIVT
jgi:iron(III) transport system ATP-binding protein